MNETTQPTVELTEEQRLEALRLKRQREQEAMSLMQDPADDEAKICIACT